MHWTLLMLVLSVPYLKAQYNCECLTPSMKAGKCIPIQSCDNIYSIVKRMHRLRSSVTDEEVSRVRSTFCGLRKGVHHVCCANDQIQLNAIGLNLLLNATCGVYFQPEQCVSFSCVAHGQEAELWKFPWMALLKYSSGPTFQCGGTLISARYVLTAAHCVNENLVEVRLGEYNTTSELDCSIVEGKSICSGPVEDIDIEVAIKHDCYNYHSSIYNHDIALLRLNRTVEFKVHIQPICLPLTSAFRNDLFDQQPIVAGWGSTEKSTSSEVLRWGSIPQRRHSVCEEEFKLESSLDDRVICAGGANLTDSCRGDSGGPLISVVYKRSIQIGIVSAGQIPCGEQQAPSLYTNILYYLQWITDNVVE